MSQSHSQELHSSLLRVGMSTGFPSVINLMLLAASLVSGAELIAQTAAGASNQKTDKSDTTVQLEKFEVKDTKTDGLNNASIFPVSEASPLPYNVIDRDEIERLGATSLEELFRNITEATNYGNVLQSAISNPGVSGGQTYSTAAVNLRGFGTTQTTVLINGRRLGPGSNVGGPDISRIPIGSIERIEILPAASASIYGGGAIGGAINIITRKQYSATDITTYVGTSTNGGGTEFRATLVDGKTFNRGRTKITTTVDFNTRQPIYLYQRNYLERALAKYGPDTSYKSATGVSYFETVTLLAYAGTPGTIRVSNATGGLNIPGNPSARYAAIPAGLTAAQALTLTPSSFSATAGKANLQPRYNRSVVYRPQDNYSLQTQLEHELIPDKLFSYFEANVAFQHQDYSFPQYNLISLSATHPLNPFRTGVTPGWVGVPITINTDTPDIRDPRSKQERNDARFTAGLRGVVSDRLEWTFDLSGQYQRLYSEGHNPQNYLSSLLTALSKADGGGATSTVPTTVQQRWAVWNPFVDHSVYPISDADQQKYFYYRRDNAFYNWNEQAAFRVVADIFDLPAGPYRISPGGEIRANEQRGQQFIPTSQDLLDLLGSTAYVGYYDPSTETTKAAYVENRIPIFSKKYHPWFARDAEIGFSRRWQTNNHSRNTFTDSISGSISPTQDILLRASLTEGFNPVSRDYITKPVVSTDYQVNVADPLRGGVSTLTQIPTYITGGNPGIRTESARTKNFGVLLRPRFVKGLSLNVNYFETKRYDTIATLTLANLLAYPQDYEGRLERAPLTAEDKAAGYTGGAITKIDLRYINLASLSQIGVDYRLNYRFPFLGTVNWTASATNFTQYQQKTRASSPAISYLGVQSYGLRWKSVSNISWQNESRRIKVGLTTRFTDSYYTATTAPTQAYPTATGVDGDKIPSSTLFDVQFVYAVPAGALGSKGLGKFFSGIEYTLGVLNVFDREPPFYTDNYGFYSRYDDPRQRFVYAQFKKTF